MRPTRWTSLVPTLLVALGATWLLMHLVYASLRSFPVWTPLVLAFLAVAELVAVPSVRDRLARKPGTQPIDPLRAARIAALAKASSLVGALFAGAWLGVLAYLATGLNRVAWRNDARTAVVGALAGSLLVLAGLLLERACRIRTKDGDDDEPPAGGGGVPGAR